MPSSRRMRITGLLVLLVVGIVWYASTGASSTQNSPFYQRTLAALKEKQSIEDREALLAEEKARLQRVERLQKEHERALEATPQQQPQHQHVSEPDSHVAQDELDKPQTPTVPERPLSPGRQQQQLAMVGEKSVAGRKKMKDDKVVQGKPDMEANDDGVARVGNIEQDPANVVHGDGGEHTEEDHKVEMTLNEILKKGPIIIFSKTYCPFSKKAKHILQDLYDISPPPYVVELDQHEVGPGLQIALEKATGRRTVPNVLINGRSIGGGDDIEALHNSGKLIDTVLTMGGKRIMKAEKASAAPELHKNAVRYNA